MKMRINNQSDNAKYVLDDNDSIIGKAILLADDRWAAYSTDGISKLHQGSFKRAKDVATFFEMIYEGPEIENEDEIEEKLYEKAC